MLLAIDYSTKYNRQSEILTLKAQALKNLIWSSLKIP